MIYIISGPSHTGKTNLAQKLMIKYQIPYISMDHIKMGLVRTGILPDYVEQDDKMLEVLWPVIREIIKTAVENKQNLIVEGCYLPYNWKEEFENDYLEDIKGVFLVMSPEYIEQHFEDIQNYACVIEDRLDDSCCTKEWILEINKECLEGCKRFGCEYKLINDEYEKAFQTESDSSIDVFYSQICKKRQ